MISRIYVEGYDTSLSGQDLVISLREHFASCGEVVHVYIPGYVRCRTGNLNSFVLIYLRREGAQEKALKLSGRDMGGHKVIAKPCPFQSKDLDPELAPRRDADNQRDYVMGVGGYDTNLPVDYVKSMLIQHFSECGRVRFVCLHKDESQPGLFSKAVVSLRGQDAVEKALQLGGPDVVGLNNIEVSRVAGPGKTEGLNGFNRNNPIFIKKIIRE